MDAAMQKLPRFSWIKVDVGESDSPLMKHFKIDLMPHFIIYDPEGQVVAEGKAAIQWLEKEMGSKD